MYRILGVTTTFSPCNCSNSNDKHQERQKGSYAEIKASISAGVWQCESLFGPTDTDVTIRLHKCKTQSASNSARFVDVKRYLNDKVSSSTLASQCDCSHHVTAQISTITTRNKIKTANYSRIWPCESLFGPIVGDFTIRWRKCQRLAPRTRTKESRRDESKQLCRIC